MREAIAPAPNERIGMGITAMFHTECHSSNRLISPLGLIIVLAVFLSGCTRSASDLVSQGEEYLAKRKFHDAMMQFRAAAELDDDLAAAHWGMARAYEHLGKYTEAMDELKKTVQLDNSNLEAKVRLGNYQLMVQPPMISETEALRDEVLAVDPNFVEGHLLSAAIMAAEGIPVEQILVWVEHAINLDPKRIETYISLQRLYMSRNNAAEAENAIRRGLAARPDSVKGWTEYGRMLMYAGRDSEAEEKFRKAIALNEGDIEAREALAEFYVVSRQLDKAEATHRELVAIQGGSPESRLVLADFLSETGRKDEAVSELNSILEESPNYALARYRLVEIALDLGDTARADQHLEALLRVNDQDVEALLLRSRRWLANNRFEDAINDLEKVLRRYPSKREALFMMAQARLGIGQTEQARTLILDLERYHPAFIRVGLLKIQSALVLGDMQLAIKAASDLIDKAGSTPPSSSNPPRELNELRLRAMTSRGLAFLEIGKTAEARADLEKVLNENPRSVSALVNMAKFHDAVSESSRAIELYERAASLDPQSFDALNGVVSASIRLGRTAYAHEKVSAAMDRNIGKADVLAALHLLRSGIYVAEKKAADAESELQRSIELDADYLPAYTAYAALLAEQGRLDEAAAQYQTIVAKRPSSQMYTLLGMLEDGRGRKAEAESAYRKALDLERENPIAANNLAWLLAETNGNLDEALNLATLAVSKSPNTAGFYDTLGWIYLKKGLSRPAAEQFRKAVAMDEQSRKNLGANPSYRIRLGMALAKNGDKAAARREIELSLRSVGELNNAEAAEAKRILASL
jgi:tetratricopeptide (TPR) repeat protein